MVQPFRVHIADAVLNDLRARIRHTRWPDFVPVGVAHYPYLQSFSVRKYVERGYNIQYWKDMPVGSLRKMYGHLRSW